MDDEYVVIIYDQIGIQEIIPTGIMVHDEENEWDDAAYDKANELQQKLMSLPYETNPLPSGGMGFGGSQVSTREDLARDVKVTQDFLNDEYEEGYMHPSIKAALEG